MKIIVLDTTPTPLPPTFRWGVLAQYQGRSMQWVLSEGLEVLVPFGDARTLIGAEEWHRDLDRALENKG